MFVFVKDDSRKRKIEMALKMLFEEVWDCKDALEREVGELQAYHNTEFSWQGSRCGWDCYDKKIRYENQKQPNYHRTFTPEDMISLNDWQKKMYLPEEVEKQVVCAEETKA